MTQQPSETVTQEAHWVYRCLSADDRLLYIGITSHGIRRFAHGHAKVAKWWTEVARIEIEHLPTRHLALLRERELILGLNPAYNKVHNGRGSAYILPKEPGPTRWLNIDDLADWLSAQPVWIKAKLEDGMPHALIAGNVRFKAEEVRSWLQS